MFFSTASHTISRRNKTVTKRKSAGLGIQDLGFSPGYSAFPITCPSLTVENKDHKKKLCRSLITKANIQEGFNNKCPLNLNSSRKCSKIWLRAVHVNMLYNIQNGREMERIVTLFNSKTKTFLDRTAMDERSYYFPSHRQVAALFMLLNYQCLQFCIDSQSQT